MGYRNPITAATAVDTRGYPTGAGVRVYSDNSNPAAVRGAVAFPDGYFGDLDAQVYRHAEANTRTQGSSQSGGLVLNGGSYGGSNSNSGTAAPVLELGISAPQPGTAIPFVTLTGAPLVADTLTGTRTGGYAPVVGTAGLFSGNTDASGLVTISHNLGVIPAAVLLTPGDGPVRQLVKPVLITRTSTQAQVLIIRTDTNAALASNPVTVWWLAAYPAP